MIESMKLSDGKEICNVQKGIPIPPRPGARASLVRLSIEEMDVGESRVFKGFTSKQLVGTCASIRKKFPDRHYIVRSMGELGQVARVWRDK